MSNWVYWALVASIFVAIVIMFAAWLWMRIKGKKLKAQYAVDESEFNDVSKIKSVEARGEDHGMLLWDLKKETKNPLDDFQMEFIINTLIRNEFTKTLVVNGDSYIETSLKKLAKQKIIKTKPQSIIMHDTKTLNDDFDKYFKLLADGGLIFVVNANSKETKKLMSFTRMTGIRREKHKKIGKGIVLIAK